MRKYEEVLENKVGQSIRSPSKYNVAAFKKQVILFRGNGFVETFNTLIETKKK